MAKVTVIKSNNKVKRVGVVKYISRRYYKYLVYGLLFLQTAIIAGLIYGK